MKKQAKDKMKELYQAWLEYNEPKTVTLELFMQAALIAQLEVMAENTKPPKEK